MATSKKTVKATEPQPEPTYVPFTADIARAHTLSPQSDEAFNNFYKHYFEQRLQRELNRNGRAEVWINDEERPFINRTIDRLRSYGFKARRSITWPRNEIIVQVPENKGTPEKAKTGTSVQLSLFGRTITIGTGGPRNWKRWFLISSGVASLALLCGMYLTFVFATAISVYSFRKM